MHLAINRISLFFALFVFALVQVRAGAATPVFLTGTGGTDPYPNYSSFNSVPVGKSLVIPIAVSGSGPMTYSVSSSSPALAPIIKTGYPVMNFMWRMPVSPARSPRFIHSPAAWMEAILTVG